MVRGKKKEQEANREAVLNAVFRQILRIEAVLTVFELPETTSVVQPKVRLKISRFNDGLSN